MEVSHCLYMFTFAIFISNTICINGQENPNAEIEDFKLPQQAKGSITLNNPLQNKTQIVGGRIKFYCDIIGDPRPEIQWIKEGKLLKPDSNNKRIKIKDTLWGSLLRIDYLTEYDTGYYTCHAKNQYGRRNTTAYLLIRPDKSSTNVKESNAQKAPTRNIPITGICQTFHSSVCGNYLSGKNVFMKDDFQQAHIENQITSFISAASNMKATRSNPDCFKEIVHITCHYNFPICSKPDAPNTDQYRLSQVNSGQNKPKFLCQYECLRLSEGKCEDYYDELKTTLIREYADIMPDCSLLPTQSKDKSCFAINQVDSNSKPFAKEKSVNMPKDCFNGSGVSYLGFKNRAANGQPCLNWKQFPDYLFVGDHSFCRTPHLESTIIASGSLSNDFNTKSNTMEKPWCFVALGKREYCFVPGCNEEYTFFGNYWLLFLIIGGCVIVLGIVCCFITCWIKYSSTYKGYKKTGQCPSTQNISKSDHPETRLISIAMHSLSNAPDCSNITSTPNNVNQIQNKGWIDRNELLEIANFRVDVPHFTGDRIKFNETIGNGQFGKIYRGELFGFPTNNNSKHIIIKTFDDCYSTQSRWEQETIKMVTIGKHPNIIPFLGISSSTLPGNPFCHLFDFNSLYNLHDYLLHTSQPNTLSYSAKMRFAVDIASGLDYLSSLNVVHKDIAARNILLDENNMQPHISDLASSRHEYSSDYCYIGTNPDSINAPIRWMAPEAIYQQMFTLDSDIWAFGVLLWELWNCGKQPYANYPDAQVQEMITTGHLLSNLSDNHVSKYPERSMYPVMLECWTNIPHHRPRFSDLYKRLKTHLLDFNHAIMNSPDNRTSKYSGACSDSSVGSPQNSDKPASQRISSVPLPPVLCPLPPPPPMDVSSPGYPFRGNPSHHQPLAISTSVRRGRPEYPSSMSSNIPSTQSSISNIYEESNFGQGFAGQINLSTEPYSVCTIKMT